MPRITTSSNSSLRLCVADQRCLIVVLPSCYAQFWPTSFAYSHVYQHISANPFAHATSVVISQLRSCLPMRLNFSRASAADLQLLSCRPHMFSTASNLPEQSHSLTVTNLHLMCKCASLISAMLCLRFLAHRLICTLRMASSFLQHIACEPIDQI